MLHPLLYGGGLFITTLLYMRFAGPTRTFEWRRSILVGVLGALGYYLFLTPPRTPPAHPAGSSSR